VPYCTTDCPIGEHNKLEPPLKRQGELTVGYGSGGWSPFIYQVREGRDLDIGFLKIYLTTKPVDLSGIKQSGLRARFTQFWEPEPLDFWGTTLIPIIQRRKLNST
jgi:hypothetical protein